MLRAVSTPCCRCSHVPQEAFIAALRMGEE